MARTERFRSALHIVYHKAWISVASRLCSLSEVEDPAVLGSVARGGDASPELHGSPAADVHSPGHRAVTVQLRLLTCPYESKRSAGLQNEEGKKNGTM